MCVSTVFKAKTKEKYEEIFCFRFWFQTHKLAFWGSTNKKKKKIYFSFKISRHLNVVLVNIFVNPLVPARTLKYVFSEKKFSVLF